MNFLTHRGLYLPSMLGLNLNRVKKMANFNITIEELINTLQYSGYATKVINSPTSDRVFILASKIKSEDRVLILVTDNVTTTAKEELQSLASQFKATAYIKTTSRLHEKNSSQSSSLTKAFA